VDFFSQEELSRRSTRYLLLLFALAFAAVAVTTTFVVSWAFALYGSRTGAVIASSDWPTLLRENWSLLALVAAGIFGSMLLASFFRTASLSQGGGQVARMLGATPVSTDTTDPLQQQLVNVVEEMAIASGLPVPEIYVLDSEPGINAFAAGLSHGDAAITVTRGALERLDRDELQGVVAHEFSHILNGDMRINQRLIGLSFGILVLALVGRWLLRSLYFTSRRSRNNGANAALAIGIALVVIGGIGVLLSRLIKAAVSRQREALADASAVQFTRETTGLAGALKKIGGYTADMKSVETEEVAHMLFGQVGRFWGGWFATHPPLIDRIHKLDPSFDPADYPEAGAPLPADGAVRPRARGPAASALRGPAAAVAAGAVGEGARAAGAPAAAAAASAFTGGGHEGPGGAGTIARGGSTDEDLVGRAGRIESPAVGAELHGALPPTLYRAVHDRESSLLLILALTISDIADVAEHQRQIIEAQLGRERAERTLALREELAALDPRLRLPLLQLCMPVIKKRPAAQLNYVFELVQHLLDVDEQRQLFDYVLLRLLGTYLGKTPGSDMRRAPAPRLGSDAALADLLAVTAAFGHDDPAAARAAFEAGLERLGAQREPTTRPDFDNLDGLRDTERLDAALDTLSDLSLAAKRKVLGALLAVIRHDRKVEVAEVELFRAIAAVLGCPLPPSAAIRADGRMPEIG
jgi:Zn-dependent protease with chaperone function